MRFSVLFSIEPYARKLMTLMLMMTMMRGAEAGSISSALGDGSPRLSTYMWDCELEEDTLVGEWFRKLNVAVRM